MVVLAQERIQEIGDLAEGYADFYFPDSWIDFLVAKEAAGVTFFNGKEPWMGL